MSENTVFGDSGEITDLLNGESPFFSFFSKDQASWSDIDHNSSILRHIDNSVSHFESIVRAAFDASYPNGTLDLVATQLHLQMVNPESHLNNLVQIEGFETSYVPSKTVDAITFKQVRSRALKINDEIEKYNIEIPKAIRAYNKNRKDVYSAEQRRKYLHDELKPKLEQRITDLERKIAQIKAAIAETEGGTKILSLELIALNTSLTRNTRRLVKTEREIERRIKQIAKLQERYPKVAANVEDKNGGGIASQFNQLHYLKTESIKYANTYAFFVKEQLRATAYLMGEIMNMPFSEHMSRKEYIEACGRYFNKVKKMRIVSPALRELIGILVDPKEIAFTQKAITEKYQLQREDWHNFQDRKLYVFRLMDVFSYYSRLPEKVSPTPEKLKEFPASKMGRTKKVPLMYLYKAGMLHQTEAVREGMKISGKTGNPFGHGKNLSKLLDPLLHFSYAFSRLEVLYENIKGTYSYMAFRKEEIKDIRDKVKTSNMEPDHFMEMIMQLDSLIDFIEPQIVEGNGFFSSLGDQITRYITGYVSHIEKFITTVLDHQRGHLYPIHKIMKENGR